jgi:hypothetical protein
VSHPKKYTKKEIENSKKKVKDTYTLRERLFGDGEKKSTRYKDIFYLICASIAIKLVVFVATTRVFGSFIDMFDITLYATYSLNVINGQIPYVNFVVEYPQLFFIPILIAAVPAMWLNSMDVYINAYHIVLSLIDVLTCVFVYFIALKFYNNRTAFFSALMYATAFGSAYFVFTKYDAYPTFIILLSLMLFLYRDDIYGKSIGAYVAASAGFFIKWFPVVVAPYYLVYDLKNKTLNKNAYHAILAAVLFALAVAVPFMIMSLDGFIKTYTFHFVRTPLSSSFTYYVDQIFSTVFHVTWFSSTSMIITVILELVLLAVYFKYGNPGKFELVKFIFISIFIFVICNKIFSPQYVLWLVPFMAILLIDSWKGIILFYICQVWFYIEFPLIYGKIYINDNYIFTGPLLTSYPFIFFTVKFIILFSIAYLICSNMKVSLPSMWFPKREQ